MIVHIKSFVWDIHKIRDFVEGSHEAKEPPFWRLSVEGTDGEFWRYVPFTVKGAIGTVKSNLALILTLAKQAGHPLKEGILPPSAFAPLSGILTRVGNLDQFYLWGVTISFIQCGNLAMFVGESGIEIVVPWE
jgi:hypothetical protein